MVQGPCAPGQRRNHLYTVQRSRWRPAGSHLQRRARLASKSVNENEIHEFSTVNRGTVKGGGTTRLGSNNLIMSYAHIGHDSQIGKATPFSSTAPRSPATLRSKTTHTIRRFLPRASVLPHRQVFLYRRAHRHHPGRSALLQNRRPARHDRRYAFSMDSMRSGEKPFRIQAEADGIHAVSISYRAGRRFWRRAERPG